MEKIFDIKRITAIICLMVMVFIIAAPVSYAANESSKAILKIKKSSPEDGDNHVQVENTGIKLYFDGDVTDKSVWANNSKAFSLTDKKGKAISTKAYASPKSGKDYILVVVNPKGGKLESKSDYKFTIASGIKSTDGKVLAEDIVYNFTTVDVEGNTKVNMGLMGVMVVGMIGMTMIQTKRQAKKAAETKDEKVNPYKIAKETGKSVEEVMEKIEKDKQKKAKRLQKKKSDGDEVDEVEDSNVHKVSAPKRISDTGSTYKTGRKAEAEKKAKAEAAKKAKGTTNPKKKKSKKKGKKKK